MSHARTVPADDGRRRAMSGFGLPTGWIQAPLFFAAAQGSGDDWRRPIFRRTGFVVSKRSSGLRVGPTHLKRNCASAICFEERGQAFASGAVLPRRWAALDRSRVNDPGADRRLPVLGTEVVEREQRVAILVQVQARDRLAAKVGERGCDDPSISNSGLSRWRLTSDSPRSLVGSGARFGDAGRTHAQGSAAADRQQDARH
jgi:hypothetical protein